MAEVPGGATELPVRGYKGKKADRLVTRIDPGRSRLVAELRGHEHESSHIPHGDSSRSSLGAGASGVGLAEPLAQRLSAGGREKGSSPPTPDGISARGRQTSQLG
jgi:hypothetical protein